LNPNRFGSIALPTGVTNVEIFANDEGCLADPADGDHLLYSFLTTSPNGIVMPVHPKPCW